MSDDGDDDDDDDEEEDEEDDEEEEELVSSLRSGALVIQEVRPQPAAGDEAEGTSARGLVSQGSGTAPHGSARSAPQGLAQSVPQGSARGASQEPVRDAPQELARSAPRRSSEPASAVAQEPARDVPPESARSAPRRSAEPAPAVAPETRGQRSGDKRPLPDAPGSTSGSEAKRARRPCSGGTAAPRGLVLQLAPKVALRVSSSSVGRTAVPPAASGGVPGEVADPAAGATPVTVTGGVAAASSAGEGVAPVPPSAPPVDPTEVVDLDADEAEGTAATGGRMDVPAAATGSAAAATEEGASAPAAAAEEVGTSAPGISAEVAPAAEAEEPARGAPAGAGEPPSAVAAEGEVAAGIPVPPLASEAAPPSGDPAAALAATGAQALGPSVNLAASGTVEPASTAAPGSAPASALAATVPRAWRGSVLRWASREDPPRHLFTLDDAAEWHKWQVVQGGLANARAALSSAMGALDNVVLPGSQVRRPSCWRLSLSRCLAPDGVLLCRLSKSAVGGNLISSGWSGGSGSASTWRGSEPGSCPCRLRARPAEGGA
nr:transcription initiation factor TFIID subunit 4-like [Setaria viridis]